MVRTRGTANSSQMPPNEKKSKEYWKNSQRIVEETPDEMESQFCQLQNSQHQHEFESPFHTPQQQQETNSQYHQLQPIRFNAYRFPSSGSSSTPGIYNTPKSVPKFAAFPVPSNTMSRQFPNESQTVRAVHVHVLKNELEQAVSGNGLNIFEAGLAVTKAYDMKEPNIPATILSFVRKYWRQISIPIMPESLDIIGDSVAMTHGYGILTQMNLVGSSFKNNTSTYSNSAEEFQKLSGSRLYVSEYYYPAEPPFNGLLIDLRKIPTSSQKAHIRLKKNLIALLQCSCSNPRDIKDIDWTFPNDKHSKYTNPVLFPPQLYNDLKQLHLEFFGLAYEELETTWIEEYASLRCLSAFDSLTVKKTVFKQLAAARHQYLTTTFHVEFREAMAEIRYSQYDESTGTWHSRKRGTAGAGAEKSFGGGKRQKNQHQMVTTSNSTASPQ